MVYTSAGVFVPITGTYPYYVVPWYGDWTQAQLDGARLGMEGWRPFYSGPPYRTGSVTCEEARLDFVYS